MSTTTERLAAEPTFEELAKRVDDAVAALAWLDPEARAVAEELKAAVEAIHRAGLVTMVRRMRADDAARAALFELVDDPTVHLLLSLHGIARSRPGHPRQPGAGMVCPQLHSHGGDVSLARVDDAPRSSAWRVRATAARCPR